MRKYSKILKQNITINNDYSVDCEDGTKYKRIELKLLNGCSDEHKFTVHKIKKIFNGELVV